MTRTAYAARGKPIGRASSTFPGRVRQCHIQQCPLVVQHVRLNTGIAAIEY
jgi:hypothetical protein